jgi:hypothetical protein
VAAAVPVRNIGGIPQNGPLEPWNPIAAIDMPTKAHQVPMVMPAVTRPIVRPCKPPISATAARSCGRRGGPIHHGDPATNIGDHRQGCRRASRVQSIPGKERRRMGTLPTPLSATA